MLDGIITALTYFVVGVVGIILLAIGIVTYGLILFFHDMGHKQCDCQLELYPDEPLPSLKERIKWCDVIGCTAGFFSLCRKCVFRRSFKKEWIVLDLDHIYQARRQPGRDIVLREHESIRLLASMLDKEYTRFSILTRGYKVIVIVHGVFVGKTHMLRGRTMVPDAYEFFDLIRATVIENETIQERIEDETKELEEKRRSRILW